MVDPALSKKRGMALGGVVRVVQIARVAAETWKKWLVSSEEPARRQQKENNGFRFPNVRRGILCLIPPHLVGSPHTWRGGHT